MFMKLAAAYGLNHYYTISYVEFLRKFLLHYAGRKFYFETTQMAWYVSMIKIIKRFFSMNVTKEF